MPEGQAKGKSRSIGPEIRHESRARMAVDIHRFGTSGRRDDHLVTEEKPHLGREADGVCLAGCEDRLVGWMMGFRDQWNRKPT